MSLRHGSIKKWRTRPLVYELLPTEFTLTNSSIAGMMKLE